MRRGMGGQIRRLGESIGKEDKKRGGEEGKEKIWRKMRNLRWREEIWGR